MATGRVDFCDSGDHLAYWLGHTGHDSQADRHQHRGALQRAVAQGVLQVQGGQGHGRAGGRRVQERGESTAAPFRDAAFRQLVQMMRDNAIISDTVLHGGKPVHLTDIRCPFLAVLAEREHEPPDELLGDPR
jgi:hypothetical protein